MITVPKFRIPFTMTATRGARVVEQDSTEDVAQGVYAVLATEYGQRVEEPEYGLTDPTFMLGGVDLDELRQVVEQWEPRAELLTEVQWRGLIEKVRMTV